jgi:hypothetical protein
MAEQLSVMRMLAILPVMALAASCASMPRADDSAARAELDKELAGKIAGQPRTCIRLDEANSAKIYPDAIAYRTSRRLTYVNASPGCQSFDTDPIFVNDVRGSQLCRGDVVRLVSRAGGIPGPFCVLGDFTPYRTPR